MPNPVQCKVVPYPGMHMASLWAMTALHRIQAGIDDTVEAGIAINIYNGTLNYNSKVGRVPKALIQALNSSSVPVILIPCVVAVILPDQRAIALAMTSSTIEDYVSKLPRIISIAMDATITPSADIFAGGAYDVPEQEHDQE